MTQFQTYKQFKNYVWNEYEPLSAETTDTGHGTFVAGTTWARRHAPRFFRALTRLEAHIPPTSEQPIRLLDVGCFPGSFARLVVEHFAGRVSVTGCGMPVSSDFEADLNARGIRFSACNLDPDIRCALDVPDGLPFQSETFDVVTCLEVVEHLYSLKTLLTEVRRILAPAGILYLTTNNIKDRVGLVRVLGKDGTNLDEDIDGTTMWSDHLDQWRGHVRFFSERQLSLLLERAGFNVVVSEGFEAYEDPDVTLPTPGRLRDAPLLSAIHRGLVGDGSRAPISPRVLLKCIRALGIRAFQARFRSHIEVVAEKRASAP